MTDPGPRHPKMHSNPPAGVAPAGSSAEYCLLAETPELYGREAVEQYILHEIKRPSKQWITSIINGSQEQDEVILRTDDYVLLPDTERVNRYWRISAADPKSRQPPAFRRTLNWLSIVHDPRIRTLRDLRGEHLPMLRRMNEECLSAIEGHTGIPREQVMAYVHYPPSVYQLHVHFSHPYAQYCHKDSYRIHSLVTIINNLEVDPEYYRKSTIQLALCRMSPYYQALTGPPPEKT